MVSFWLDPSAQGVCPVGPVPTVLCFSDLHLNVTISGKSSQSNLVQISPAPSTDTLSPLLIPIALTPAKSDDLITSSTICFRGTGSKLQEGRDQPCFSVCMSRAWKTLQILEGTQQQVEFMAGLLASKVSLLTIGNSVSILTFHADPTSQRAHLQGYLKVRANAEVDTIASTSLHHQLLAKGCVPWRLEPESSRIVQIPGIVARLSGWSSSCVGACPGTSLIF